MDLIFGGCKEGMVRVFKKLCSCNRLVSVVMIGAPISRENNMVYNRGGSRNLNKCCNFRWACAHAAMRPPLIPRLYKVYEATNY